MENTVNPELGKFKEEMYLIQQDVKQAYYERAITKCEELIAKYPDRAEPHYELSRMAYNFWNNQEAEKHCKKALEVNPEYFPTYTQYALVLIKENRFEECEYILKRAELIQNKENADIFLYYGMMYQHKNELDLAIQCYKSAINYSINENQIDMNLKFIRACIELRGWE